MIKEMTDEEKFKLAGKEFVLKRMTCDCHNAPTCSKKVGKTFTVKFIQGGSKGGSNLIDMEDNNRCGGWCTYPISSFDFPSINNFETEE